MESKSAPEPERLVGDSYSANPHDLARLRELASSTGRSKAQLIREAIRDLLTKLESKG